MVCFVVVFKIVKKQKIQNMDFKSEFESEEWWMFLFSLTQWKKGKKINLISTTKKKKKNGNETQTKHNS